MEQTSKNCLIGSVLGAVILACSFLYFGGCSVSKYFSEKNLIEVQGLSERIVRADIATVKVEVTNMLSDLVALGKKQAEDRAKVLEFLKQQGVANDEIVDISSDVHEVYSAGNEGKLKAITGIHIKTKDFNKIDTIKANITNLSSEGLLISLSCKYKITNFQELKLSMMEEASQNARKSADSAVKPYGRQVTDLAHFAQGAVSITSDDASATDSYDYENSVNKKVRLVVRAGFRHK